MEWVGPKFRLCWMGQAWILRHMHISIHLLSRCMTDYIIELKDVIWEKTVFVYCYTSSSNMEKFEFIVPFHRVKQTQRVPQKYVPDHNSVLTILFLSSNGWIMLDLVCYMLNKPNCIYSRESENMIHEKTAFCEFLEVHDGTVAQVSFLLLLVNHCKHRCCQYLPAVEFHAQQDLLKHHF